MKLWWDLKSSRLQKDTFYKWADDGIHHFEPDDYFGTKAKTKQPKWWRDLSMFEGGIKTKAEFIAKEWEKIMGGDPTNSGRTAKACPAFINFFKQSIALKTPSDIYIDVFKNAANEDRFEFTWKTADNFWDISMHSEEQLGDKSDESIVLKFSHDVCWRADQDCQFQYVDPFIDNMVHYRVCPGIIRLKKGDIGSFNMPVFFAKREEKYWIPAGTTIGYLQFDKPIRSWVRKDLTKEMKSKFYRTFIKGDHSDYINK